MTKRKGPQDAGPKYKQSNSKPLPDSLGERIDIRCLLEAVPPDCPHNEYIQALKAVKAIGGETAKEAAEEWCRRSKAFDQDKFVSDWQSIELAHE